MYCPADIPVFPPNSREVWTASLGWTPEGSNGTLIIIPLSMQITLSFIIKGDGSPSPHLLDTYFVGTGVASGTGLSPSLQTVATVEKVRLDPTCLRCQP